MRPTLEESVRGRPAPEPMLPQQHRIQRVRRETSDAFTLDLAPADEGQGLEFAPGQFNMLYVFGAGEVPISMSGDPVHSPLLQHTVRAVGTVTRRMRQLRRGDVVGVRGPFGRPWPLEEAADQDLVIVAGGIGLAPLRSALYHALAHRKKYRKIVLLYGSRTPEDLLYRNELQRWRGNSDLEVHLTVDSAASGWGGNVGVVTRFIARTPFDPSNAVALVCGPEVMMRFTVLELQQRGVAAEHIYLSMERNMKCAVGFCGHCQYGPSFICRDGPVFRFDRIAPLFGKPEI